MGGPAVLSCRRAAEGSWHDVIERQRVVRVGRVRRRASTSFGLGPPATLQPLSHPPLVLAEQHPAELLEPCGRVDDAPG